MANPFSIDPPNPLAALMIGVQGYDSARKRAKEQEQEAAYRDIGDTIQRTGSIDGSALGRLFGLGPQAAPMLAAAATLGKADTTDEIKEYNLDMRQRSARGQPTIPFGEWKTGLKIAGATKINNTVNTGENEYAKSIAKSDAERMVGFQKTGQTARGTIDTLNRMESLVNNPSFTSGIGAETFDLPLRQTISRLGGDPKSAAPMEEFRALSSRAALDGMGGSLGTGFSNADRDFIVNQYPNLGNTPEGNRMRIEGLRKIEQRKIDIAKKAREYATKNNGRLDAGFDDELADWAEKNPLFPRAAAPRQSAPLGQQAPGYTTKRGIRWNYMDPPNANNN